METKTCPTCYAEVKDSNIDEHDWWHINLQRSIADAYEAINNP